MSVPVSAIAALVVDDDESDLAATAQILTQAGMAPVTASSGDDACEILSQKPFDLVVTDIIMRGLNGYKVVEAALAANPHCICVTVTSFGSLEAALDSLSFGAYSFAQKPLNAGEFMHVIKRGLEQQRLTKELIESNRRLATLNAELESKVQAATQELRDLNTRILTEMASLKEVDGLKSTFLGNVTHDLRTPLTSIRGYLALLLEDSAGLPDAMRTALQSVWKASQHMEYLVSQLLEAAQLTSGTVKLDKTHVTAIELLEECIALHEAQAVSAGIKLEIDAGETAKFTLVGDRGRLFQVLNNLAGNALKFTPKGGRVALSAQVEGSSGQFCVADTGPGIAAEHRERIFDRFFQAHARRPDSAGKGLGLGLNIAKDIVTLHGGKLWVVSEPGAGSKFYFQVPLT